MSLLLLRVQDPGFPRYPSHACLSVNDCIVHGTATYRTEPLGPGDVLKIDIGILRKGWIGDAAWTYVFGELTPDVRHLTQVGKESMRRGLAQLIPGNHLEDWARAVQGYVEGESGLHLIRGYGGHGYGTALHTPPFISNVVPDSPNAWPDAKRVLEPGMLLAVEPMVAIGTGETREKKREWPVYTRDGSMSVHYEHDVLITDDGNRLMTEGLEEIEDVILA